MQRTFGLNMVISTLFFFFFLFFALGDMATLGDFFLLKKILCISHNPLFISAKWMEISPQK
jgi:hypothetical protein